MAFTSGNAPRLLQAGLQTIFGDVYPTYKGQWEQLFKTFVSDKQFEDDLQVVSMGLPTQLSEGNTVTYDTFKQGWGKRYTHAEYAKGFAITRVMLEDVQNAVSLTAKASNQMMNSMAQLKEIIGANIFNNAFSTAAANLGGDGKALLRTDHPLGGSGGTFQNTLTSASDLTEASLEQARIDISHIVDDAGLRIQLRPGRLVVPVELITEAVRITQNPLRAGTADRDINALYEMGIFKDMPLVNNYLTDTDAWFILVEGLSEDEGLKHLKRRAVDVEMDNDFNTGNLLMKVTERYCFGWTNPRALYGSPGA